jgi:hypothetical protein
MRVVRRRSDVDVVPNAHELERRRLAIESPGEFEARGLVEYRWTPGDVLVVLAGVVVAVAGVVALTRTEVDGGWYRPVEQVAGFDHTQPLGVIEVGVGVALVLLGLSGMRVIAALLCMAGAATAAVAAVDPGLVDRELALERSWAIILAAGGVAVAILSVLSWQAMIADGRPSPGRRHGYGGLVQQH